MRKVCFGIVILLTVSAQAQITKYTTTSEQFFLSGIVLGSEREKYYSSRLQGLGTELNGIVSDQISDVFRNPATIAQVQNPVLFSELVRISSNRSSDFFDDNTLRFSSPIGFRVGYINGFSIFLRGTYAQSTSDNHSNINDINFVSIQSYQSEEDQSLADAIIAYGISIGQHTDFGLSYAYGLNNYPSTEYRNEVFGRRVESAVTRDTLYDRLQIQQTIVDKNVSHIFSGGIVYQNDHVAYDIVARLEFLSATISRDVFDDNVRFSESESLMTSTIIQKLYTSTQLSKYGANIRSKVVSLQGRRSIELNSKARFTTDLTLSLNWSSSDDILRAEQQRYSKVDTAVSTFFYNVNDLLSITGNGLRVKGRIGWEFRKESFLFGFGPLLSFERIFFYNASSTNKRSRLRMAIPLGFEHELLKNFHIRGGWVAQYTRIISEIVSSTSTTKNTNDRFDYLTVTFGMGAQVSENLRADFVNFGNISEPRSWNISATYTF